MDGTTYEVKLRVGNYRYPVTVRLQDDRLRLAFRYNPGLIEEVKNMGGARWNPGEKVWTIDNSPRNLFVISYLSEQDPYKPYNGPLIDFKPRRRWPDGSPVMMIHQVEMAAHGLTRRQCIFACEMRTGKTLAAIEAMEQSGHDDWIWVGPRSALYAVKIEFAKWKICDICGLPELPITFPDGRVLPAHKKGDHPWLVGKCVTPKFYTYDGLRKLVDTWPKDKPVPKGLVGDESSRCKNPLAQRSQAMQNWADEMRRTHGREAWVFELSGTPAPNSPTDWWSQCEIACPGFLKEGNHQKFTKRLAVIEDRENLTTGGVYPHRVCWRDSINRCEKCGEMKESVKHDMASGGHTFVPCTDEVSLLYKRMSGLVLVKFKKDCLDLPEMQYKILELQATPDMIRAAGLINAKSATAIQALTLLRELSDGFQYRETEMGTQQCPICSGSRTQKRKICVNKPDMVLDALSIQTGKVVTYDDCGTPTVTTEDLVLEDREVACEACDGIGEIAKLARTTIEGRSPKEDALNDILDEHEDVGRLVVYAGFEASVNKCVNLVKKMGWEYLKVDGKGWVTSLREKDPVKLLTAYQTDKSIERFCFIGHPGAAGMGIDLAASPTTVYFSNDFNAESRIQSEQRIHGPMMNKNLGATIIDLVCLPSDLMVLNNLKRKRRLQDLSLGQMRDEIAQIKFSDIRMM